MRWFTGYFLAAVTAAAVAMLWILVVDAGQTVFGSLRVPDVVTGYAPEIPIQMRRLHAVYGSADRAVAMLFDFPAAVVVFLVLNLPGALMLLAFDTTWADEPRWQTWKPVWASLLFGVMAATFALACLVMDLPPFAGLRLSPLAMTVAAIFAGTVVGMRRPVEEDF